MSVTPEPPLTIGCRVMPSRYFLSPLAGYTQLAFRRALRELGGLGLATTDLVQATLLRSRRAKSLELIATTPDDTPLSIQIFSGLREELAEAARWLEAHGYQGIDINMGCPMAKVSGTGGGARMMCDTQGACDTLAAVIASVKIPVSVKMRLGWDRTQLTAPALAREFEQLGAAAVTVHGRTRAQGFHGTVDLDGIAQVVAAVDRMPVIGNGDVRSPEDAFHMRTVTGCQAVAIGRGALLDPWIFDKLRAATDSGADLARHSVVPFQRKIDFLSRHFTLMHEQHAEHACILFRKFAGWYGQTLEIPDDLEDELRVMHSSQHFAEIVSRIRERQGDRRARVATALVKVPNGPVDKW